VGDKQNRPFSRCDLVAPGTGNAQGAVQAGSRKGTDGKETEPWQIIYVKLYQSQMPVIERAIEIACLMLGSDRSRG
jgi:hypothetical protein